MGDRNDVLAGKFATSVWQRGIEPRMYSRSLMSGAPIRPAEVRTGGVLSRTGENNAQTIAHRAGVLREDAKAQQQANDQNRRTTAYEGLTQAQTEKAVMDTAKTHQELLTAIRTAPYRVADQIATVRLKTLDAQKKALENQIAQATASSEIAQANAKLQQINAQIGQIQAQTEYARQRAQGQWQDNNAVTQDDINALMTERGWTEAQAKNYYRNQGLTIQPVR